MKNYILGLPLVGLMFLSSSCGSDTESFVSKFVYAVDNEKLSLAVDFTNVEINTEFNIPVKNYGAVLLNPDENGTGMQLGFDLNLSVINDSEYIDIEKTRKLPNGQPISRYLTEDVVRVKIKETDQITTSLYLSLNPEKVYLGTALELNFMDENFPAGLVISQRIFDQKKRSIGVLTIYGPKVDGQTVIEPGGFFFMTNVSDLIAYSKADKAGAQKISGQYQKHELYGELTIDDAHKKEFSDKKKILKLYKLIREKGREAGVMK